MDPVLALSLAGVPPPDGALLTTIIRGQRVVVPRGHARLRSGDVLLVAATRRPGASPTATAIAWARGETDAAEPY